MDTIEAKINLRRGLDADRRTKTFQSGEIVYSTDIKRVFIGDNVTIGGNYVGNKTFIAATTASNNMPTNGIEFDSVFSVYDNSLFVLTGYNPSGNYGSENISNYKRVTPISDNVTINYDKIDGVFSLNLSYFNNQNTGFLHLSGDVMKYGSFITLGAAPTANMHATTRLYVDTADNALSSKITSLSGAVDDLKSNINSGYVHLSGDTLKSVANGGVGINFNNTPISNFLAKISSVSMTTAIPYRELSASDCGAVLYITLAETASEIRIPNDLPIGFNVLLITNALNNVTITASSKIGGVTIINYYDYRTLTDRGAMCNILVPANNVAIIAGDLSP